MFFQNLKLFRVVLMDDNNSPVIFIVKQTYKSAFCNDDGNVVTEIRIYEKIFVCSKGLFLCIKNTMFMFLAK